jgi:hypothetical protein
MARRGGSPQSTLLGAGFGALVGSAAGLLLLIIFNRAPGAVASILVLVAVPVLAALLVMAVEQRAASARREGDTVDPRTGWPPSEPPVERPPAGGFGAPPAESGRVDIVAPGSAWWDRASRVDGGAAAPAPSIAPPRPDLAAYGTGSARLVAQCPECSSFRLDVRQEAAGLLFGCRDCRREWTWAPGRVWPTTVADPSRRVRHTAD